MENESIGQRGMGINYKGSQGQTERAVALQEEEINNSLVRFEVPTVMLMKMQVFCDITLATL